jgi:hypothetical protein
MHLDHSRRAAIAGLFLLAAVPIPGSLKADVVIEETYQLSVGWNFIQVPFDPLVQDPQTALAAVNWDSIWAWLPGADPERGGKWVAAYRDAPAFLNSLAAINGPGSYAVLLRAVGTLKLKGTWRAERPVLRGGLFQLFAPKVPAAPPTLADYLSRQGVKDKVGPVFEHVGGVYRRVGDGDPLRLDAAYWVFPAQDVPLPDPLRIDAGFGGLRFDAQVTAQEIEIDLGAAPAAQQLSLRAIPSADAAGGADWIQVQKDDGTLMPLNPGVVLDVLAGQTTQRVVFQARKLGASPAASAVQTAVIEVSGPRGRAQVGAELSSPTIQGVWTGEALISQVEKMSLYGPGYAPSPPLAISIILEIPATGHPRLLPCLQVEANRDGKKIDYRVEAAMFHDQVELTGSIGANGSAGVLTGALTMAPDHPLNPYRHRYHPEHGAGYDFSRAMTLSFGVPLPGAPSSDSPIASVGVLSGIYEEEISGLAQEPIRARGAFRLRRFTAGTATPCGGGSQ